MQDYNFIIICPLEYMRLFGLIIKIDPDNLK